MRREFIAAGANSHERNRPTRSAGRHAGRTAARIRWPQATYPVRPVRILVGWPAGQSTDISARKLAQLLIDELKQPFIVENRPGAGGGLAVEQLTRAEPDGYTLLVTSSGPMSINRWIYSNIRYDVDKDIAPIATMASSPLVLVVSADSPFKSLPELIRAAKARPGKLNYASSGNGTITHLTMEYLKLHTGANLTHVPYKGYSPAVQDLLGGSVDAMFDGLTSTLPLLRQGRLRALAVTSEKRVDALPEVPTVAELGYPGYVAIGWSGFVAPAGTPPAVLERLHAAYRKVSANAEWQAYMHSNNVTELVMDREAFADFVRKDSARWGRVAREAHIKVD